MKLDAAAQGGVSDWLAEADLSGFQQAFTRERIQLSQLGELTDESLRELGLALGERLRFHKALKATPVSPAPRPNTFPERRPLTIMFVDVVDSTGLSDRLEVEDLIEVMRIYREFCDGVIRQYGGHVAQFFGDGIMAFFCYPVAHENDAERAVSAGLDIARGMPLLANPVGCPIEVRVGIATGRVVVSDLFSGGSMEERKVSGSTPNLAARLQGFAAPGEVVVSELTHELVGPLFECRDSGLTEVRGFGKPQHVFRVVARREKLANSRLSNAPLTPLFGREEHLSQLSDAWRRVGQGEGLALVICGEAGIGKSRLVERFLASLSSSSTIIFRTQTSALNLDSPLYPFTDLFKSLAGFEAGDGVALREAKLRGVMRGTQVELDAAVIAELLQLRADAASVGMPPEAVRARGLETIVRQLADACDCAPVILLFEDIHWADATSRALLGELAVATRASRFMMLVTTRERSTAASIFPEDRVDWITLARLENTEAVMMVQSMFGDEPVPAAIAEQIAEQTDGIPLFIEEYVRPLLFANAHEDWTHVAPRSLEPVQIPTSLHESLMARLDRSGGAKELAQIASVVGRTARADLLANASGLTADRLASALKVLQLAGVLHPVLENGVEAYAFGHALVRQAAYDSILRERRRELHAYVARALEEVDPETIELRPELLAVHLTEAGMVDRALEFWVKASERSVRLSSLFEAIGLIRRALGAMAGLESTPARVETKLKLMALLGPALIAVRGPGSAEVQALYADAYQLTESMRDSAFHFRFAWGWWRVAKNFAVKKERATTLLVRASLHRDSEMLLQAHHCNWAAHFELGDFCGCIEHVKAGLAIYEAGAFSHHASMYGNHDAEVCAHGELAQVYWMQGRIKEASDEERRASLSADGLRHLGSRVHAMDMSLLHQYFRRDVAAVRMASEKLIGFASEHGLTDHRAKGRIFAGWAMALEGEVSTGLDAIRTGMARQREIGTLEDFPMYVAMLAETLVAARKADIAIEELNSALAEFDALGLKIWIPEVMRHLARATLAADPAARSTADRILSEAAAMAEDQGASMLGLRIAMDAAASFEIAGDSERAHDRINSRLSSLPAGEVASEIAVAMEREHRLANALAMGRQKSAIR